MLARLIRNMNYTDCFRHLHPGAREFTFHRGANIAQSRLDRVYLPPHLLQQLLSAQHRPGLGDHCLAEVELDLRPGQARPAKLQKKTFWKLNTSLLDNPDFKIQFQAMYTRLTEVIDEYRDHAEWWEEEAKPAIAKFCKEFSALLAIERKNTKQFLYTSLKIFLMNENWTEVARVKEELRRMLMYDMTGLKIRSRQSEHAEEERGSIYHYNKERKGTGSSSLTKLRFTNEDGDEEITDEIPKIEKLIIAFYDALFNGRHDKNLVDTGTPFQLSDRYLEEFLSQLSSITQESKTKLVRELTMDELEVTVKTLPNGKSPGLDGIPYEFYKYMWEVIGRDFLEVVKDQMRFR